LLEVIQDKRFILSDQNGTSEILRLVEEQLNFVNLDFFTRKILLSRDNLFEITEDNPILFLASQALYFYLCIILYKKTHDPALQNQYAAQQTQAYKILLSLRDAPKLHRFTDFFDEIQKSMDADYPLHVFEGMIIRTLIPIAPYMIKLIRLSKQDLDWCQRSGIAGEEEFGQREEEFPVEEFIL